MIIELLEKLNREIFGPRSNYPELLPVEPGPRAGQELQDRVAADLEALI